MFRKRADGVFHISESICADQHTKQLLWQLWPYLVVLTQVSGHATHCDKKIIQEKFHRQNAVTRALRFADLSFSRHFYQMEKCTTVVCFTSIWKVLLWREGKAARINEEYPGSGTACQTTQVYVHITTSSSLDVKYYVEAEYSLSFQNLCCQLCRNRQRLLWLSTAV